MNLPNLNLNHIKAYLDQTLGTSSASTYERKLASLKKFFNWAQKEGYLASNPLEEYLLSQEGQIVNKINKIEETKAVPPSSTQPFYSTLQNRIIARYSHKPKLQNFLYKAFYSRPNWYQTYHSLAVSTYVHLAILIIFSAALAFGVYDQFKSQASQAQAFPTALTRPNRFLSFQGRLTNQYGNPITVATDLTFKLYDVSSGGTELWSSTACSITPDPDGIFSTLLGSSCGTELTSDIFTENADIWLGITVGGDAEATPRIQIATVAYALNSETLQGYPASASAVENTIPVIDNTGNLVIGVASPKIQAISASGAFVIEGQTGVTLSATDTSNSSININPDGTGTLNLTFEGAAPGGSAGGFVNATNANITSGSLYFGQVASDATGYDLIQLKSGSSPTEKFAVDYAGNTNIAGTLDVGSTLTITGMSSGALYSNSGVLTSETYLSSSRGGTGADNSTAAQYSIPYYSTTGVLGGVLAPSTAGYVLTTNSTGGAPSWTDADAVGTNYWQRTLGSLAPLNITDSLNLGATATGSALVHLAGTSGENSWINTGNLGVGNASPGSYKVNVTGDINFSEKLYIDGVQLVSNTGATNSLYIGNGGQSASASLSQHNTSLGVQAMYSVVEGDQNVAVGSQALYTTTWGLYNTAIGTRALYYSTVSNNTALGYQAGYNNVTGQANTFIGQNAGVGTANYSGSDHNVIVGYTAGNNISGTSLYNVLLGSKAGYSLGAGADGNVFLGYSAGYNESGSNKLYIENSDSSTPLVYGDFSADLLRINGRLDVTSYATVAASLALGTSSAAAGPGNLDMSGNLTTAGTINGLTVSSGTISSGTWNGSLIGTQYGGTGADNSAAAQYSIPYYSTTGVLGGALAPSTAGYVLTTNSTGGAPSWTDSGTVGTNYWQRTLGSLAPLNITDSLNLGATATGSALVHLAGTSGENSWINTGNLGIGIVSPTSRLHVVGSSSIAAVSATDLLTADGGFDASTGWTTGAGWTIGSSVASHATGNTEALSGTSTATSTTTVYKIDFTVTATTAGDGFTVSLGGATNGATYSTAGAKTVYVKPTAATGTLSFTPGALGTFVGTIDSVTIYAVTASTPDLALQNSDGAGNNLEIRAGGSALLNTFVGKDVGESNVSGGYNSAFGAGAFASNVSGSYSNAFGQLALSKNTTGGYNNAFGYGALANNTSGTYNSAFGHLAMNANISGYYNSAFGQSSLSQNTTGIRNSAFGFGALSANTTGTFNSAYGSSALAANVDGDYNSAFGTSSLSSNISGDNNVAYGSLSLALNTSGSNNTATGYSALYQNTSGGSNTAMGYDALYSNTTGGHNTSVGEYSLLSNKTGSYNSAVGKNALYSNKTGGYNSAFGVYTLTTNSTGSNNTGYGYASLRLNTTGSANTAMGFSSLYSVKPTSKAITAFADAGGGYTTVTSATHGLSNGTLVTITGTTNYNASYTISNVTTDTFDIVKTFVANDATGWWGFPYEGIYNTALGYNSGYNVTTGSYNTLLGYSAGDALTTGNTNIVIGYNIDLPAVSSSNMLDIGNLIYATGLTSTGTTVSTGSVGIGTTTPTAKLDIEGSASTSGTLVFRGTTDPKINILNGENFGIQTSVGGDTGLSEVLTLSNSGNLTLTNLASGAVYSNSGLISSEAQLSPSRGGTGADNSAAAQYSIPYYSTTGVLGGILTPSTAGYVLSTNSTGGAPTWIEMTATGTNYWQLNNTHILSPLNDSFDLAVGGTATASSKFQILAGSGNIYTANNTIDWTLNNAVDALNIDSNTLSIDASNNRVGIGTAAPDNPLHIISSVVGGLFERTTTATNDIGGSLNVRRTSSNDMADNFGSAINFEIEDNAGTSNTVVTLAGYRDGADNTGGFRIYTYSAGSIGEALRIDAGKQLGLGEVDPDYKLDISLGSATDAFRIQRFNDTDSRAQLILAKADETEVWRYGMTGANSANFTFYDQTQNALTMEQNGNVYFTPAGNVGVGTTGPDAKLESLSTSAEQLRLTYTDNSVYTKFTSDSSGNLTIDATGTKTILADDLQINGADILDSNGNEFLRFSPTASAVNELTITNAAANGTVTLAATGGDTNIALSIDAKGSDALNLNNTGTGDVLIAGGSGDTGCTISNSSGDLTCSGTISGSIVASSMKWNALTTPDGALTLAHGTNATTMGWIPTGDLNAWTMNLTNQGASATTQNALVINNAVAGSFTDTATENLLLIQQLDTTTAGTTVVTNGIKIDSAGSSSMTNGLTITNSAGNLTTGINIADTVGGTLTTGITISGTVTNAMDAGGYPIVNIGNANTDFNTNGGLTLAENLVIQGTTGLTFNTGIGGDITFAYGEKIDNDTDGTIAVTAPTLSASGNLVVQGTTGLTFNTGAGGDITFANGEKIDNDTNGTINVTSTVLGMTGGTSFTTDQTSFNLLNTTVTTLSMGGAATTLNLGTTDSVTRTINLGTGTGVDTINVGTGATGADVINIGSANAGNVTVRSNAALALIGSTNSYIDFTAFDVSTAGTVTLANAQSYTGAGVITLSSGGSSGLTLNSASGVITIAEDDDLIPTLGAGSADLGSDVARWDNLYATQICLSGDCQTAWPTGGGAELWQLNTLTLSPIISSYDLAVGGTATASSKFQIMGTTGNIYTANNTIDWTLNNAVDALNFDSNTLSIDASNNNIGIGTAAPVSKLFVSGGYGGNASVTIDQTLSGDILTASASGATKMTLTNAGVLQLFNASSSITNTAGDITIDAFSNTISFAGDNLTNIGTLTATNGIFSGVIQGGGSSAVAYSRLGTNTTGHSGNIDSSSDLLISGDIEIDGTLFLDNGIIANSAGTTALSLTSSPTTAYSALSASSWLVENTANLGMAALMVNQTKAGDLFTASSSGTPKFVIENDGDVTIGSYLRTFSNSVNNINLYNNGISLESYLSASFNLDNDNNDTTESFRIATDGNTLELLRVTAAGYLGLGTSTPTNIISLGNTSAQKFWIEDTAAGTVGRALTVAAGGTTAGTADITGGNLILQAGLGTGTGASTISFQTGTTLTTGTTLQTMSTKMTILGSGNVGIGTTSPLEKLHVSGFGIAQRGFISLDSYFQEEFNRRGTLVSSTATLTLGDDYNWGSYENTNCAWGNSSNTYFGYMNASANAINTECLVYTSDSTAATTITPFDPANLPFLLTKFFIDNTDEQVWVGMSTAATAPTPTDPSNGIFWTNGSIGGTTWVGKTCSGGTCTTVSSCGTVSTTNPGIFAIRVNSTSSVDFLIDPDLSDGTDLTLCGTSTTNIPTSLLAGMIQNASGGTSSNADVYVDYFRVWSDDPDVSGSTPMATSQTYDASQGADIAENYPTVEPEEIIPGTIVSASSGNLPLVQISRIPGDTKVIGIVSTAPAQTIGDGGDGQIGIARVALVGRVPVRIDPTSKSIKAGDYITSSGNEGMGKKATQSGITVGKALEDWTPESGKESILVFVNLSSFNSDIFLASADEINIFENQDLSNPEKTAFSIKNLENEIITKIGAFSNIVVANIKAGSIQTKDFIGQSFTAFQGKVDNLLVTTGLVSPNIKTQVISPLADSNLVIDLNNSTSSESADYGKLVIKGKEGQEVAAIDEQGNATFSGTLYADQIIARNGILGEIQTASTSGITREEVEAMLAEAETNIQNLSDITSSNIFTASTAASLEELVVTNLFVTERLTATNLSLTQNLTLGSDLVLQSSLNENGQLTNSLDSLSAPLSIQSLALAPLQIMAGKFIIETNGDVKINGNLYLAGNIESYGLTLRPNADNPESSFGKLLSVKNDQGEDVAQITASGSAVFNDVTTNSLIIAGSVATQSADIINGIIETNATVGQAIIPEGLDEIKIVNPKITNYTLIYVTPTSSTNNNVLYVKSKGDGFFTVGFNNPTTIDVNFNWWIIDSTGGQN